MNFEEESESDKRHNLRYHMDGYDPAAFGIIVSRRKGISSERWLADDLSMNISKTDINGITWFFGEAYGGKTKALIYACDVGDYCYSVSFNSDYSDSFDFSNYAWAFIRRIMVSP